MRIDYAQLTSFLHPKLIEVLAYLEEHIVFLGYQPSDLVITSMYRPDKGVHDTIPLRAVDLRVKPFSSFGKQLETLINDHFTYSDSGVRPVAIFHSVGRGIHLHIQVHPQTQFIKRRNSNEKKIQSQPQKKSEDIPKG